MQSNPSIAPDIPRRSAVSLCMLALAMGCGPATSNAPELTFALALDPSPPVVGDANITLTVANADGTPLRGADVRLEGNMNHAGMKPSFADLEEVAPGKYAGALDFTMGGDWFILATVQCDNGTRVQHKVDVPGVQSK